MKKAVLSLVMIFALLFGGCSQDVQQVNHSAPSGQEKSDFPNRSIEIIVPFAAGGSTDLVSRALASVIHKYLPNGQNAVVINKPGGAGVVGTTDVFQAKPDGYTVGIIVESPVALQPHYGQTAYAYDDLQPIMRITSFPMVLYVNSDSPWNTYEEWLEYVKQNPGEFTYAVTGTGNTAHIAMEALNGFLGTETTAVPFDGSAPSLNALLGGHVQGAILLPHEVKSQFDSGSIRALLNLGGSKVQGYEEVPLAYEKGIEIEKNAYSGLFVPKGLPEDIQHIIHDAFKRALEDPELIEQLKKLGLID